MTVYRADLPQLVGQKAWEGAKLFWAGPCKYLLISMTVFPEALTHFTRQTRLAALLGHKVCLLCLPAPAWQVAGVSDSSVISL